MKTSFTSVCFCWGELPTTVNTDIFYLVVEIPEKQTKIINLTVYVSALFRVALCFLGVFLITRKRKTKTFEPYVTMNMAEGS